MRAACVSAAASVAQNSARRWAESAQAGGTRRSLTRYVEPQAQLVVRDGRRCTAMRPAQRGLAGGPSARRAALRQRKKQKIPWPNENPEAKRKPPKAACRVRDDARAHLAPQAVGCTSPAVTPHKPARHPGAQTVVSNSGCQESGKPHLLATGCRDNVVTMSHTASCTGCTGRDCHTQAPMPNLTRSQGTHRHKRKRRPWRRARRRRQSAAQLRAFGACQTIPSRRRRGRRSRSVVLAAVADDRWSLRLVPPRAQSCNHAAPPRALGRARAAFQA